VSEIRLATNDLRATVIHQFPQNSLETFKGQNRSRGFRAVRGQKWWSFVDFNSRPYNRSALLCCLWSANLYNAC